MTLVGATVHVGTPPAPSDQIRQVSSPVNLAAAIDTSPNAVGIAESELYFMTPEEVEVALDTMQSLGVTQVRIFVPWRAVEPAPGEYNWTEVDKVVNAAYERDMAVLGAVTSTPTWASDVQNSAYGAPRNPEDFGSFMGALAERYGAGEGDPETARISAYEIWNEPQSFVFWNPRPDPAAYTELLKAGYTAVKEVDPTGTVVGGVVTAGLSWGGVNINPVEFVQTMYESGAAGYFDALSYHPYNYDWKFGDGFGNEISAVEQLRSMQALMEQYGDGDKTVWTSEYGLPTSYVSEEQQAEFIGDFMDTWSELDGVGPQFIYSLVDRNSASTEVEDTWGLFRDDYTPKQAAAVVEAWIEENGPIPDGGIPIDELPPLEELPEAEVPTDPVIDPVTEEPTSPEPVDPVAEAVANWQAALAEAAANWAAAWGQTTTPTATTQPVSATTEPVTALSTPTAPADADTTVAEAELAEAVAEATTATQEAATAEETTEEVDAPTTATDPALESTDSSRAAVIEATQAEPEDAAAVTESDTTDAQEATAAEETADTSDDAAADSTADAATDDSATDTDSSSTDGAADSESSTSDTDTDSGSSSDSGSDSSSDSSTSSSSDGSAE
ncbi:cellulase family glycosylhydrolase [Mycobacterium sp. NPDC003323]